MSAIGTTAATNYLFDRPQSKYGRVNLTGPGFSSAPRGPWNVNVSLVLFAY